MKNKKLLAAAITAASLSAATAQAGVLAIQPIAGKVSQFATHIFGTGSETQSTYLADLVYVPAVNIPAGTEIRFNLGDGATFADTVTANHFLVNDGAAVDSGTAVIKSGGAIGDFDVTITLAQALPVGTSLVFSAGNGTVATAADTAYGAVTYVANTNVEFQNVAGLGTAGTTIQASVSLQNGLDPTAALVIARSADPLALTTTAADTAAALPNNINMADSDLLFSTGGFTATGQNSLASPGTVLNHAGTVNLAVTTNATTFTELNGLQATATLNTSVANLATTARSQISDPAGNVYAPDGADSVSLAITSNSTTGFAPFATAGSVYAETAQCTTTASGTSVAGTAAGDTATFPWTASVGTTRNICVNADGTTAVEPQSFTAVATYSNFEPTYQDATYTGATATWVRNGCSATFFNVTKENGGAGDETFLRFTNTTAAAGPVRVRAWAQDGTRLGSDGALLDSTLAGHATAVYTPEDVQTALGVSEWTGRSRVVVFGGFNSCVGQNMTRAGGILVNNTATTDANDSFSDGTAVNLTSSNSGN